VSPRPRYRQRLLFPLHDRKSRPTRLPRITEDQAAEMIIRNWHHEDGSPITEEQAWHWAWLFHHHLAYELTPAWITPRRRRRPERPTAERLQRFISLETDWIRRTPDNRPVTRRDPADA
jgi:hypothetical protein